MDEVRETISHILVGSAVHAIIAFAATTFRHISLTTEAFSSFGLIFFRVSVQFRADLFGFMAIVARGFPEFWWQWPLKYLRPSMVYLVSLVKNGLSFSFSVGWICTIPLMHAYSHLSSSSSGFPNKGQMNSPAREKKWEKGSYAPS